MARELLDCPCRRAAHREVRTARVPQAMNAADVHMGPASGTAHRIADQVVRQGRSVNVIDRMPREPLEPTLRMPSAGDAHDRTIVKRTASTLRREARMEAVRA